MERPCFHSACLTHINTLAWEQFAFGLSQIDCVANVSGPWPAIKLMSFVHGKLKAAQEASLQSGPGVTPHKTNYCHLPGQGL